MCWTLGAVILPLAAAATWGYLILQQSLPPTSGTLRVSGIEFPVTLTRDDHGVAYIQAQRDTDAFYALGLAHAQDRLWQLELQRRMGRGEMSEIFGRGSLQLDIFVRTLGIRENAAASLHALSDEAKSALSAYAAGINSWIDGRHELPSEFAVLRVKPQHWTPADSLAWLKVFALSMSLNYRAELDNYSLAAILDESRQRSLALQGTSAAPVTVPNAELKSVNALAQLASLGREVERLLGDGKVVGSNAWAIAARHSSDGKATLANDPHLGLELPSMWYVASLKGEKLQASGMTLVGLPLVLLGRNQHIAWGATNMMADTQDLYFEQVNANDPNQYRQGEAWRDFASRTETFNVKADFPAVLRNPLAPVQVKIRSTLNGPIITDATGVLDQPVALRWTGSSRSDTSFDAFLRVNYAGDWATFNRAMALHVAPALNLVYVDAAQNIGYLAAGQVPIRGIGQGKTPLQGWLPETAWRGFIPASELPRSFNPGKGYVVSANNQVAGSDYPYFISDDWAEPARAQRIEEMIVAKLAQNAKLSAADQRAMQVDYVDKQAAQLLPELLQTARDEDVDGLLDALSEWDGRTDRDSIASTVFFTWMQHLRTRLFADELKTVWGKPELSTQLQAIVHGMSLTRVQAALAETSANWCDDIDTAATESCDEIKSRALRDTYKDLQHLLGSDPDDWQWSEAHQVVFAHRPFSSIKGLDFIYERRLANGGSENSINVAGGSYDRNEGFTQTYGAGFRQILQPGAADAATHIYMNSTGQSGNVLSRHYDDMIEPYVTGAYYSLTPPDANTAQQLKLIPTAHKGTP
jgi:penicillin amidase